MRTENFLLHHLKSPKREQKKVMLETEQSSNQMLLFHEDNKAQYSKVPKLIGRISGDVILFVSSKLSRLEARSFAVIFIFIPFTTYEKTSFTDWVGRNFTNGFSGPKRFRDFPETGPRAVIWEFKISKVLFYFLHDLPVVLNGETKYLSCISKFAL